MTARALPSPTPVHVAPRKARTAFARIERLMVETDIILSALAWLKNVGDKILLLAELADEISAHDPDVAIASVHLSHRQRPAVAHAVHMALLCGLTARRMEIDDAERIQLIAAAISSNAGMLKLHDTLLGQPTRPAPSQLLSARNHPGASVELLVKTGVRDPVWIDVVHQHHERPDGTGYPAGLSLDQLRTAAMMVGLADRYATCVNLTGAQRPVSARKGLRDVFKDPAYENLESLVGAFIKELSIFPPGSFVEFDKGPAIVVRRGIDDPLAPSVAMVHPDGHVKNARAIASPGPVLNSLPAKPLPYDVRNLWNNAES